MYIACRSRQRGGALPLSKSRDSRHPRRHLEEIDDPALIEVLSSDGNLLIGAPRSLAARSLSPVPLRSARFTPHWSAPRGQLLRVLTRSYRISGDELVVRVADQLHIWQQFRQMLGGLLLGLPFALLVAGLGGHWLAARGGRCSR